VPFAPHEIENKKFIVALRGYQTDEVDAFLRAVAADYRAALDAAREAAARDSAERRPPERQPEPRDAAGLVAEIERVMGSARETAEQEAAEIRQSAEREAAEVRAAVHREAEACYEEIARQAEQLHRIEARLRAQLHALEHAVAEGKEALVALPPVYGDATLRSSAAG
jgi:DivIVA domain-containing protein